MRNTRFAVSVLLAVLGQTAIAAGFDRPIPQAQTGLAEFLFAIASIVFCIALYAVHRVVKRW